MSLVSKILTEMAALKADDIAAMSPAERRRLADQCRYWALIAEPEQKPKSGVLADLRNGAPRHE